MPIILNEHGEPEGEEDMDDVEAHSLEEETDSTEESDVEGHILGDKVFVDRPNI